MKDGVFELLLEQLKKRLIDESFERIKICLNQIEPDKLWHSPNEHITSIGSSILHLNGNIRQWLRSIIEGREVERDRPSEFKPEIKYSVDQLLNILSELDSDVIAMTEELKLIRAHRELSIQGIETNGIDAIVHVIEHTAYHTGQIVYLTKYYSGRSTHFYAHLNLDE